MTRPPRFAIVRAAINDGVAHLTGAEFHHLRDVARLRPGARVSLIDEAGREYTGAISALTDDCATITVQPVAPAGAPCRVVLAAALIKGPRMDFLIEKAAELGAAALIPLRCARCVVQGYSTERIDRWRRLALAAAKQSHAPIMEIGAPSTILEMLAGSSAQARIVCTPDGAPLLRIVRAAPVSEVVVAIGPEGDFTGDELAAMRDAGFRGASLGPYRLRSETAALAALSITAAALAELHARSKSAKE